MSAEIDRWIVNEREAEREANTRMDALAAQYEAQEWVRERQARCGCGGCIVCDPPFDGCPHCYTIECDGTCYLTEEQKADIQAWFTAKEDEEKARAKALADQIATEPINSLPCPFS